MQWLNEFSQVQNWYPLISLPRIKNAGSAIISRWSKLHAQVWVEVNNPRQTHASKAEFKFRPRRASMASLANHENAEMTRHKQWCYHFNTMITVSNEKVLVNLDLWRCGWYNALDSSWTDKSECQWSKTKIMIFFNNTLSLLVYRQATSWTN